MNKRFVSFLINASLVKIYFLSSCIKLRFVMMKRLMSSSLYESNFLHMSKDHRTGSFSFFIFITIYMFVQKNGNKYLTIGWKTHKKGLKKPQIVCFSVFSLTMYLFLIIFRNTFANLKIRVRLKNLRWESLILQVKFHH